MAQIAPAATAILTNPTTWKVAGAAGGIVSALGSGKQGQQTQNAFNQNAQVYDQQAEASRRAAEINAFKRRKALTSVIGAQQGAYAARGVSPITGSPIDVATNDYANGLLDIAIDSYNYDVAARHYDYQADIQRYYGEQEKSKHSTIGVSTLLKTAADFGYAFTKKKIGE